MSLINKKKLILPIVVVVVALLANVPAVFANTALKNLQTAANSGGLATSTDLPTLIGNVVKAILQLVGVLLLAMIIYGGVLWGFLANGDPTLIKKARAVIINSIIGIIIVFAAYAIANYVLTTVGTFSGEAGSNPTDSAVSASKSSDLLPTD